MKWRDSFKAFWVSFRQWVFILYREERWKRAYMREELRRKKKKVTQTERNRITNKRLQLEQDELERSFRLGEKIFEYADFCFEKFGEHLVKKDGLPYDVWYTCLERGKYHRCQRCGMLFHNDSGKECLPAEVGKVCDCMHCRKFVGSHLRREKNG